MKNWKYYAPKFECDKLNNDLLKYAPWSGHRNFVYDFTTFLEPKTVVELGSHYGCSAFTFAQAVKDNSLDTQMYFVDTWQGDDFTKKYDNDVYTIFSETVKSYYSSQKINMLRMTFNEAVNKFEDNSIDLLHIDGSHHYDDVKGDFENWLPKVNENGIIMLHDVSSDIVLGDIMGSHRFWNELKEKYSYTFEFDFSWGLGIIFLNEKTYESFVSQVDDSKYQRLNNGLDVEYKDQLRKNHFKLLDNKIYIDDLLKQKDILNKHLDAYKISVEEKDKYTEELLSQINELNDLNIKASNEIDKINKDYNNQISKIIEDYEEDRHNVIKDYENTIVGKDAYISELEIKLNEIQTAKTIIEEQYKKTINYKLERLKNKVKK